MHTPAHFLVSYKTRPAQHSCFFLTWSWDCARSSQVWSRPREQSLGRRPRAVSPLYPILLFVGSSLQYILFHSSSVFHHRCCLFFSFKSTARRTHTWTTTMASKLWNSRWSTGFISSPTVPLILEIADCKASMGITSKHTDFYRLLNFLHFLGTIIYFNDSFLGLHKEHFLLQFYWGF